MKTKKAIIYALMAGIPYGIGFWTGLNKGEGDVTNEFNKRIQVTDSTYTRNWFNTTDSLSQDLGFAIRLNEKKEEERIREEINTLDSQMRGVKDFLRLFNK